MRFSRYTAIIWAGVVIAISLTRCDQQVSEQSSARIGISQHLTPLGEEVLRAYTSRYPNDTIHIEYHEDRFLLASYILQRFDAVLIRMPEMDMEGKESTFRFATSALVFVNDPDTLAGTGIYWSDSLLYEIWGEQIESQFNAAKGSRYLAMDLAEVSATEQASAVTALFVGSDSLAALPSVDQLASGSYPYIHHLEFLTNKIGFHPASRFVRFACHKEGQQIALRHGLLPAELPEREVELSGPKHGN